MKKRIFDIIINLSRFIISTTLIVSGIIKAIDPVGMGNKLASYLTYWGVNAHDIYNLLPIGSITLAVIEVALGVWMFVGMRRRLTAYLTLSFISLLTLLTLYIYIKNPVPDCGCFGDAITLTNGQTLAKNLVLLACCILVCLSPRRQLRLISIRNQWLVSIWSVLFCIALGIYSWNYLPPVDFSNYKVGKNIADEMAGEWDVVNGESVVIKEPSITDFCLFSQEDEDVTEDILLEDSLVFLVTIPNIKIAEVADADRLNDINDYCNAHNLRCYGIFSEGEEAVEQWKDLTGATYPALFSSSETLESMVRSTPGLMLLKNGQILQKWSSADFPQESKLAQTLSALPKEKEHPYAHLALWFILPLSLIILIDRLWIAKVIYRKLYNQHILTTKQQNKTMRKHIVAGNWKMNKTLQEGVQLATELKEVLAAEKPNCEVIIGTPFIHLATVSELLKDSCIAVSAENCANHTSGAYTGEVSASMVKSTGAEYVILGHSERREYYAETPEILKEKVDLALDEGLKVIFCIGESLEQREANEQETVCKEELANSVFHLTAEQWKNIVIAYEPIWAIGTGKTATAEQAEEIHAYIRKCVADVYGAEVADETSILYGGSCKASNAPELFAKADIDGGLIGGASLKAADFKGIIDAWN